MTAPAPVALLDTQAFVWYINGDRRLSEFARDLMHDRRTRLLLSAASVWEIITKIQIRKLKLDDLPQRAVPYHLRKTNTKILPVRGRHALRLLKLPWHHGDPFDRIILAQAHVEGLPIISADAIFEKYPVKLIW